MSSLHRHWPLFDLSVRTPRLQLRYPDDELAAALADLAAQGIHDPAFMPFNVPWTDHPSPLLEREALKHYWQLRSQISAEGWSLPLAVFRDGHLVGCQALQADHFPLTRVVKTGSWLGQRYQAQGIGKEMRAAVVHLAFAGLGAQLATSAAFDDNLASIAVSRSLGYKDDGTDVVLRRDQAGHQIRFRLERRAWEARQREDIIIDGLEPCLDLLGIPTDR